MYDTIYDPAFWAVMIGSLVVGLIIGLAAYVVIAFFMMKLFAKANVPAWKAWVPIVNIWKLLELGGYPGALCLLVLASPIPILGWFAVVAAYVFMILAAHQINLKMGKETVWIVLFIFLMPVWLGIMGLGQSTWNDSLGKPAKGNDRPPSSPVYGGGYPPAAGGYTPPPAGGYTPPPAGGYTPPPTPQAPPAGGYTPPPAPQAPPAGGYTPPPTGSVPPPTATPIPPAGGYTPPPQG